MPIWFPCDLDLMGTGFILKCSQGMGFEVSTSWWRLQMETFSAWRIHRSPINYAYKGQWRGALMFSLICVCINSWVNNHEAGDLRRHHTHFDVIVMCRPKVLLKVYPIKYTCAVFALFWFMYHFLEMFAWYLHISFIHIFQGYFTVPLGQWSDCPSGS